ncbi:MAG: molybdenum cofactor biosysynthesis protein [Gammaproteobacteria bacterium]|nr:molybdenum cofactor biosysynthesis protein [Gammaproteobacteria bacterium]
MPKLIGIATHAYSSAAIDEHSAIYISQSSGLENDFQGAKCAETAVTLLSNKTWQSVCQTLSTNIDWTELRANLLIDRMDFSTASLGEMIEIGEVILRVTAETNPCKRMDQLFKGLTLELSPEWRGGVRCQVVRSGWVHLNNTIRIITPNKA